MQQVVRTLLGSHARVAEVCVCVCACLCARARVRVRACARVCLLALQDRPARGAAV